MNRLLLILILTLSIQTLSKADDIREFQIDGLSIGMSLLDYFNETEIKDNIYDHYKDDKYKLTEFYQHKNFNQYDSLKFHYNSKDQNYKIISISGINFYEKNITNCYNDMKKIDKEISSLFEELEKITEDQIHPYDKSGKSITKAIRYWFPDESHISIVCYDWSEKISKENEWTDNLQLEISLNEFNNWLIHKAYK